MFTTDIDPKKVAEKEAKARFDLIDPEAMLGLAKVLTFGASKHGALSWREYPIETYIAATHRHLNEACRGKFVDAESEANVFDHLLANVMFLRWFSLNRPVEFLRALGKEVAETEAVSPFRTKVPGTLTWEETMRAQARPEPNPAAE